jgi:hypothetical protein
MAPKRAGKQSFGIKNPLKVIVKVADCAVLVGGANVARGAKGARGGVKKAEGVKVRNPIRMENNRKAAARSRANKRAQALERENTILQLRHENTKLEAKVSELSHTVLALQYAAETNYGVWMDGSFVV